MTTIQENRLVILAGDTRVVKTVNEELRKTYQLMRFSGLQTIYTKEGSNHSFHQPGR